MRLREVGERQIKKEGIIFFLLDWVFGWKGRRTRFAYAQRAHTLSTTTKTRTPPEEAAG